MINGAKEIVYGIPARHLDPMLLAKSQTTESTGFIMVTYEISTEDVPPSEESMHSGRRFYDLLFLKGPTIYDCARLNQDLRFKLNIETSLLTFSRHRNEPGTLISLFQSSDEIVHRFQLTFYYEPCLNVQIETLSEEQMSALLDSFHCRRGIIECNAFARQKPAIELTEIHSTEQLAAFQPAFEHGKLLLYDIHKNKEVIRELYRDLCEGVNNDSEQCQTLSQLLTGPLMTPSCASARPRHRGNQDTRDNPPPAVTRKAPSDLRPRNNEETDFIPVPLPPDSTVEMKNPDRQGGEDIHSGSENLQVEQEGPRAPEISRSINKGAGNEVKHDEDDLISIHAEYVKVFKDLYSSFRQAVAGCYDGKSGEMIAEAENKIKTVSPEFDCNNLTGDSAPLVLDLVESVVQSAPFYRRQKIRQGALTLISCLYSKQYDLLEKHNVIENVEQVYYRLKN